MPLDLHRVAAQIEVMGTDLQAQGAERLVQLERAIAALNSSGKATGYPPTTPPEEYRVLATDGSHIDVDRHMPVRCSLINISKVSLQYGTRPDARLESHAHLYATPEELSVPDPWGTGAVALEGRLMGIKRSVEEVVGLAEMAEEAEDIPTLALVDGSLVLWGREEQSYPEYVRESLLNNGLLLALSRIKNVSREKPVAMAAYISLPRSADMVRSLQSEREFDGLLDRDLFARVLQAGERSDTFASTSPIVKERYGEHQVHFFYLKTEHEIARVEVPVWVAEDEALLSLAHTLILDQCRKGMGYPTAIMEAHEQAVIGGRERELFRQMVEDALAERGLPVYTSEKALSKRVRPV